MNLNLAFLLLSVLTIAASGSITGSSTLEKLIIVHRHGARTPLLSNPDQCGPLGCGQLSPEGRRMLESLGGYLRTQYGHFLFPSMDDTSTYYNPEVFGVRSSGESRTVQSAEAMLSGLFAFQRGESPFLGTYTKPSEDDNLLRPQTTPGNAMWNEATSGPLNAYLSNVVIPAVSINYTSPTGMATLKTVGEELNLGGECVDPSLRTPADTNMAPYNPFICLLDAQDYSWFIATTFNTSEWKRLYPTVFANFKLIDEAMHTYNEWWYYKYGDVLGDGNYTAKSGSIGRDLAKAVLKDAAASTSTQKMQFVDYSTHDTTIMPLAMAFGNMTVMRPDFGAAFVFEVRRSVDTQALYVVAKYGNCDQTPGSAHIYTIEPFMLKCIDNSGVQTSSDTCLVGDVDRYIDTVQTGSSPMGFYCYLSNSMRETIQCTPQSTLSTDIALAPSCAGVSNATDCHLQQMCIMYRQRCPQWACVDSVDTAADAMGPVGALGADWNCYSITSSSPPTPQQAAVIADLQSQIDASNDEVARSKIILASLMASVLGSGFIIFLLSIAMSKSRAAFLAANDLPHQKPLVVQ